ncbi:MAG: PAS domain-containing protein [Ignavibacteriales bacterium]|nr:PAS domain-containing protein [Ignavibacteriales bacterium]
MVFEVDRHGHVLDANETALKSLGYERDEIMGLDAVGDLTSAWRATVSRRCTTTARARAAGTTASRAFQDPARRGVPGRDGGPAGGAGGPRVSSRCCRGTSARASGPRRPWARAPSGSGRCSTRASVAALLLDSGFLHDRRQSLGERHAGVPGRGPGRQGPRRPGARRRPAGVPPHARRDAAGTASEPTRRSAGWSTATGNWSGPRAACGPSRRAAGSATSSIVLENFTERKIFEEQLQVALRDQQTLFETMSVGVAQTMSGKILLANREFAEMFGYSDGEVIGMPLWDLVAWTAATGCRARSRECRWCVRTRRPAARSCCSGAMASRSGASAGAAHPGRGHPTSPRCRRRSTRSRTPPRSSVSARRCRVRCWS